VSAPTILTVDDSPSIRRLIAATLSSAGFEVCQAEDGEKGLAMAAGRQFAAIISDVNMPVMGGMEFVANVRTFAEHKYTPILMLTTEFEGTMKQEGKKAGASGWLIKPLDPDHLLKAVKRLIGTMPIEAEQQSQTR